MIKGLDGKCIIVGNYGDKNKFKLQLIHYKKTLMGDIDDNYRYIQKNKLGRAL